jgi:tagaturonate reductase
LAHEEKIAYAQSVLERFRNPFVRHEILSIALNSVSKWKVRVLPSLLDYQRQIGHVPAALAFSLAALIYFYRGTSRRTTGVLGARGEQKYPIRDEPAAVDFFQTAWNSHCHNRGVEELVRTILAAQVLWDCDLTEVPDLVDQVARGLASILQHGMRQAVQRMLDAGVSTVGDSK